MHLTRQDDAVLGFDDENEDLGAAAVLSEENTKMHLGRLSFMQVLANAPSDAEVFFCGAPALQWKIEVACSTHGLGYHPGHRFASDGHIGCKRTGSCRFVCSCTKFPLCLLY